MKNKFIVIEGIDGAGKTTFAQTMLKDPAYLERILQTSLVPLHYTKEPTNDRIKAALCNYNLAKETKILLIEADRQAHCQALREKLQNSHILCDRYYYSTLAYQFKDNFELMLEKYYEYSTSEDLLQPDLIVYLECGYQLACDRVTVRAAQEGKALDYYEKRESLRKIQQAYNFLWANVDIPLIKINTNARELCLS